VGDVGQMPLCNFLAMKKPQTLLRLGFGLSGFVRTRRQGEDIWIVESNLCRDAALLPVLDALHAVAQAAGQLCGAAQGIDEVFVGRHLGHRLV
jgi:hypothetical protein